jgi:hypothetical protein
LPPKSRANSPHTFEVIAPFDVVAGPIAPWFGEPGRGTQYFVPHEHGDVDGLIASEKIKEQVRYLGHEKKYFNPDLSKGYLAGKKICYECLLCGEYVDSLPEHYSSCQCGNIAVDADSA